ncbi:MAG: type II secretion system F family protein [Candidatus Thermoplasmatota archaeon]|nr:type II secretion system F family protein [Candidatus Thermoplasmatota archaeon]
MAKKNDNEPLFEGMVLTTWQKISNTIFGPFFKTKARQDQELMQTLAQADIRVMPEVYKSQTVMSAITATIGSLLFLTLIFLPDVGAIAMYENQQDPSSVDPCIIWAFENKEAAATGAELGIPGDGCPYYITKSVSPVVQIVIALVFILAIPIGSYRYFMGTAEREKKARGERLEKFLPYAASYTAAMAAANATPMRIFKSLAANEEIYGEIAYDSAMIYRDISLLGMDLITAIKHAVNRAASPWATEFFQGMVGTLSSGGNLKLYFLNRAEHYMRENRIRLTLFLDSLGLMAESYVVVAVAMPLFLIVMLVIMFWVSGAGSQISEGMVYGIVMGVLPMIHIAYSGLVWLMSEEQKM